MCANRRALCVLIGAACLAAGASGTDTCPEPSCAGLEFGTLLDTATQRFACPECQSGAKWAFNGGQFFTADIQVNPQSFSFCMRYFADSSQNMATTPYFLRIHDAGYLNQVAVNTIGKLNEGSQFQMYTSAASRPSGPMLTNTRIPLDEWVHLCYTADGAVKRGYVNGALDVTANVGIINMPAEMTYTVQLGAPFTHFSNQHNGYVADVFVSASVLSDAEVLERYARTDTTNNPLLFAGLTCVPNAETLCAGPCEGGLHSCADDSYCIENHDGSTSCECPAGTHGDPGVACDACPADHFCADSVAAPCAECSEGHYRTDACTTTSNTACAPCAPGVHCPDGVNQYTCPSGMYCTGGAPAASCPDNAESPSGSDELTDCVCVPGSAGSPGGACALCEAGTYCPDGASVVPCPGPTASPVGSAVVADCYCVGGYYDSSA